MITEKPTVVFMVPSEFPDAYAIFMKQLTLNVQRDLGWEPGSIELIGLVAGSPEHGAEGIFFLEEMGIDTRKIALLVLWENTAEAVRLQDDVSPECGVGGVVLPATGVVLPVVRMPTLDGDWWLDPLHQEYAALVYSDMVSDGKTKLELVEPRIFMATPGTWN